MLDVRARSSDHRVLVDVGNSIDVRDDLEIVGPMQVRGGSAISTVSVTPGATRSHASITPRMHESIYVGLSVLCKPEPEAALKERMIWWKLNHDAEEWTAIVTDDVPPPAQIANDLGAPPKR